MTALNFELTDDITANVTALNFVLTTQIRNSFSPSITDKNRLVTGHEKAFWKK